MIHGMLNLGRMLIRKTTTDQENVQREVDSKNN